MLPEISHYFAGGVYAKETRIPAGLVLVQHKHHYDHLSFLASGTVHVQVDGETKSYTGPCCLTIEAGKLHGVQAVTDSVWLCIHSSEKLDADEADAELIVDTPISDMKTMAEGMLI